MPLHHLRLDIPLAVHREKRVEDVVAEAAGDVGGGVMRIEDGDLGL